MNINFLKFIEDSKRIASDAGLSWDIPVDPSGRALKGAAWDLRALVKNGKPTTAILGKFSIDDGAYKIVSAQKAWSSVPESNVVSESWQDLIKAFTIEHLLIRQKSVGHAGSAASALRFLATTSAKEPWEVTAEDVQISCEISDQLQPSGGRSIILRGICATLIDPFHLFDACPISACLKRSYEGPRQRANFVKKDLNQPKSLTERRAEEKLPERKAFWEIIRIVFTEQPNTFNDALRFAMIKVLLMTGLRINEVAFIPKDWKRTKEYFTGDGRSAGEIGGASEALLLRHFAEKQGTLKLYEAIQFVPLIFKDELESTLVEVEKLTMPLRATLRAQYDSHRIFPMYSPDQLVDSVEMYVRLTGNPIWTKEPLSTEIKECISAYKKSLDASILSQLNELQRDSDALTRTISRYFSQERRRDGLAPRHADGSLVTGPGMKGTFLRVEEVERYIRTHLPTKLSDIEPLILENGDSIAPWEMLFLMPKRAVGAGRGQTILDPNITFSVGISDSQLLLTALGSDSLKDRSLFSIYGCDDEAKSLSITTHSFRHLQNTELFRLGVADTIITKRFNRRSVAQSYEYDHRSLAEELDEVSLPKEWDLIIGHSKAAVVAKMIQAGKANGPIVREFKRIQAEEGDHAALLFLAAEADGFHATPYGTCLNSFTVDPCPKHLECFTGCRHLSATNLPEHQRNILALHGKLKIALEHAQSRSEDTVGRSNQISHITERLAGVEALMKTPSGMAVFPSGKDFSVKAGGGSVLDGT